MMQCKFCAAQASPGWMTCGGSACVALESSYYPEIFSSPVGWSPPTFTADQSKTEPAKPYLGQLKDKRAALAKSISALERKLAICVALIDFLEQRPDAGEIVKGFVKGLGG